MELYAVVISNRESTVVHSVHKLLRNAEAFRDCKTYDGECASIILLSDDVVDEIVREVETQYP